MASINGQVLPDTDSRLVLRSRLGAITLVLLCAVQFLDIADSAIVNVALPSIQHSLGFSQQNLQWVASGYILTYGGFLLLGGRLGDLLGRRRLLLTGLAVFAVSSLAAGLAGSAGLLVAARLTQGIGAALMAPQAPSAVLRSLPSRKLVVSAESAAGAMSAAPMPCASRAATRSPALLASPAASEDTAKTARPVSSRRRRPSRSPKRPPSRRKPP